MKKMITLLLGLTVGASLWAQNLDVCVKECGDNCAVTVIKPTIHNFKTLLSGDAAQFKQLMEANKYFGQEDPMHNLNYWNGSDDNFSTAKCVNSFHYQADGKTIRFMVGMDMVYPRGDIELLYRALQPYFKPANMGPRPGVGLGMRPGMRPGRNNARGGVYELTGDDGTFEFSIVTQPHFFIVTATKK